MPTLRIVPDCRRVDAQVPEVRHCVQ